MSQQPLDVVATDEAWRSFLPGAKQEDDSALIPTFFVDKKLMGLKSKEAGKPVYEDREYCKIMIKGQDKQIVVHEVDNKIKERFPIAYLAFQRSKPLPVIGTPIELLPGVGPSLAHHLKGMNLRTVEDVAGITDENVLSAMGAGARDLVKRSRAWLEQTSEKSLTLQAQIEEKDAENLALKEQIAAFESRFAALESKPKRPSVRAVRDRKKAA